MLEYRAEGLCRNANHLRRVELERCMIKKEVLQSTALAFDTSRRLRFETVRLPGRTCHLKNVWTPRTARSSRMWQC